MIDLIALVLSFNEEENIGRTLAALTWVPELLLVDSFSTDRTLEIARASHPNVRIVQRRFDTHVAQWNFGLDQIHTTWVFSLDADYEVSPALRAEIESLVPAEGVVGFNVGFRFRVFGHPLRATLYPPRTVLFRRELATYVEDGHTQLLRCEGTVKSLNGTIYHDDRKPLSRWLQSQDRYMLIETPHLLGTDATALKFQDRLRRRGTWAAVVMFFYLLIAKGLILDGWPGWYYVLQRTLAEALLALRIITEREGLEPKKGG